MRRKFTAVPSIALLAIVVSTLLLFSGSSVRAATAQLFSGGTERLGDGGDGSPRLQSEVGLQDAGHADGDPAKINLAGVLWDSYLTGLTLVVIAPEAPGVAAGGLLVGDGVSLIHELLTATYQATVDWPPGCTGTPSIVFSQVSGLYTHAGEHRSEAVAIEGNCTPVPQSPWPPSEPVRLTYHVTASDLEGNVIESDQWDESLPIVLGPLQEADSEIAGLAVVNPPSEVPVGQDVALVIRTVAASNGPYDPGSLELDRALAVTGDCTVLPSEGSQVLSVPLRETRVIDETVLLHCSEFEPGPHTFMADATLIHTDAGFVDTALLNNEAATSFTFTLTPGVGGTTELHVGESASSARSAGGSGPALPYAALAGGLAAAALAALTAGGCYARRRWLG